MDGGWDVMGFMPVMNAYKLYDYWISAKDAKQKRVCYNKPQCILFNAFFFNAVIFNTVRLPGNLQVVGDETQNVAGFSLVCGGQRVGVSGQVNASQSE
ncbi:hypothetical protein DZS_42230 [Dickeya ananatis]